MRVRRVQAARNIRCFAWNLLYTHCDIVAGIAETGIPCCRQRIDAAAAAAVAVAAAAEAAADAGDAIRRYEGGMAAMGRARADPTRRHWTPQLYNDPAYPSHDADDSRGRSYFHSFFLLFAMYFFLSLSLFLSLSSLVSHPAVLLLLVVDAVVVLNTRERLIP